MSEASVPAWHVYILRCADGTLYTGITNRVAARVDAHNTGRGARYTRGRLPVELVYEEVVGDRGAALRREAEIRRLPAAAKRGLAEAYNGAGVQVAVKRRPSDTGSTATAGARTAGRRRILGRGGARRHTRDR